MRTLLSMCLQAPGVTVKETCIIVGAYKHPKAEMMYLVEWPDYTGTDKIEWLPARHEP